MQYGIFHQRLDHNLWHPARQNRLVAANLCRNHIRIAVLLDFQIALGQRQFLLYCRFHTLPADFKRIVQRMDQCAHNSRHVPMLFGRGQVDHRI